MPEVMKEFERRFFPLVSPTPAHSNAGPGEEMTDQDQDVTRWRPLRTAVEQLVAKARSSLEPINAAIARVRAVASEITTAVRDRPRRDWRSTSIPYVAAFSSIAMLGVFVMCTSFVSSPDVLAQAVNGGSPAGAPQAQRPPTPTSKLLQPNQDPKEVGSSPSPADVTPSEGSRQPVVPAVPPQVDLEIEAAQRRPALSSDDTYLVERALSEPISFDRPSSSSRRPGRSLGLY